MKSKIIVFVVILVVLIAAGVIWYWQRSKKKQIPAANQASRAATQQQVPAPKEEGLGAQVYEKVENPVKDEVPDTNPIKNMKLNPFAGEYSNPFE